MKKKTKPKNTSAPKNGKRLNAGPKLKGFLGVTRKRPEPDNPIVQRQSMPIGIPAPNPGSKKSASAARVKRLEGRRI